MTCCRALDHRHRRVARAVDDEHRLAHLPLVRRDVEVGVLEPAARAATCRRPAGSPGTPRAARRCCAGRSRRRTRPARAAAPPGEDTSTTNAIDGSWAAMIGRDPAALALGVDADPVGVDPVVGLQQRDRGLVVRRHEHVVAVPGGVRVEPLVRHHRDDPGGRQRVRLLEERRVVAARCRRRARTPPPARAVGTDGLADLGLDGRPSRCTETTDVRTVVHLHRRGGPDRRRRRLHRPAGRPAGPGPTAAHDGAEDRQHARTPSAVLAATRYDRPTCRSTSACTRDAVRPPDLSMLRSPGVRAAWGRAASPWRP